MILGSILSEYNRLSPLYPFSSSLARGISVVRPSHLVVGSVLRQHMYQLL
jgi:hypothetical protein